MDAQLMGRLGKLVSMALLAMAAMCLYYAILWGKHWWWCLMVAKAKGTYRRRCSIAALLLATVALMFSVWSVNRQKIVNSVLVRATQRQTKGMNDNLGVIQKRLAAEEQATRSGKATLEKATRQLAKSNAADDKKKADTAQEKADAAEKVRMRAVFKEEIAKIREVVEKEAGMSWKDILERSKKKEVK